MNYKHGQARKTREYNIWSSMVQRCHNPRCTKYPYYGKRGIRVSRRWRSFRDFFKDMGKAPTSSHTLERKNTNGHYSPRNCRWATQAEQQNNRRDNRSFLYRGVLRTLKQWAAHTGIKLNTLRSRVYVYDYSIKKAIETPVRSNGCSKPKGYGGKGKRGPRI